MFDEIYNKVCDELSKNNITDTKSVVEVFKDSLITMIKRYFPKYNNNLLGPEQIIDVIARQTGNKDEMIRYLDNNVYVWKKYLNDDLFIDAVARSMAISYINKYDIDDAILDTIKRNVDDFGLIISSKEDFISAVLKILNEYLEKNNVNVFTSMQYKSNSARRYVLSRGKDEVLKEIVKDKPFYENSGGGVTLSGGEPLAQYDFSLELLKKAKENGIHTTIETCGYAEKSKILEIAKYVDLFLFDCKETDQELHKEYTGFDNKIIPENLKALSDAGSKIILRCPIIPGFNDRAEHFKGISETAEKFIGIEHIEIEPSHPLGESKYSALGRKYANIKIPDTKTIRCRKESVGR